MTALLKDLPKLHLNCLGRERPLNQRGGRGCVICICGNPRWPAGEPNVEKTPVQGQEATKWPKWDSTSGLRTPNPKPSATRQTAEMNSDSVPHRRPTWVTDRKFQRLWPKLWNGHGKGSHHARPQTKCPLLSRTKTRMKGLSMA